MTTHNCRHAAELRCKIGRLPCQRHALRGKHAENYSMNIRYMNVSRKLRGLELELEPFFFSYGITLPCSHNLMMSFQNVQRKTDCFCWNPFFFFFARCLKRQLSYHNKRNIQLSQSNPMPAKLQHVTNIETCTSQCCNHIMLWKARHANMVENGARCSDKMSKF